MRLIVLAGVASLAAATAFTAAAAPAKSSCVWTRDLRNHTVGDANTLYFNVGGRSVYRVTMSDNCLAAVTSSDPIVMRDRGASGQLCSKLDWDISVRGAHCIVSDVTQLSPEEAAALPRRVKP